MSIFLKSFFIGLSIAAPVGPIGLLCIQRSLLGGWRIGFATGLGAATADGMYGLIGALGVSVLITSLTSAGPWLSLLGGMFLCYLGVRTVLAAPAGAQAAAGPMDAARSYGSTFLLTASNPMTILSFIAIFAALGTGVAASGQKSAVIALVVSGVFVGSGTWWLALSGAVSLVRERISEKAMRIINYASGITVLGFGLYQSYLGSMVISA
ncbi:LysE family translocator [Burkholderia stagnalis]|uniref:LysE family translocator n=1 Tax=Burkholderia stagnalis TaxID=1503054 RepID=UPI00075C0B91|nr:LysE family transporter [Burkholderia stagnalis]KVL90737.1 lysine transporter LysE [Burkholderia stagnalis]KVL93764.1 lysine transporter LysE [Burkholderia stagnalis]KVM02186.1 lysine transporter LysE [Burkholderia stagnalis]